MREARIVKRQTYNKSSSRVGGVIEYQHGTQTLEPDDSEYRRRWYASRPPEVTQLINTFNFELYGAEAYREQRLVETMRDDVVKAVLASKIFSDLSSFDTSLGMTSVVFEKLTGYKY